jgi:hypothetical protein
MIIHAAPPTAQTAPNYMSHGKRLKAPDLVPAPTHMAYMTFLGTVSVASTYRVLRSFGLTMLVVAS